MATLENIDLCLCIEPVKPDIESYLRNVLCDLFRREWQLDEEVIAELENAADCVYVSISSNENTIGINFGTTYTSTNLKAQNIIEWILEARAKPILNSYAEEEITNSIRANPEPIIGPVSQAVTDTLQKGG